MFLLCKKIVPIPSPMYDAKNGDGFSFFLDEVENQVIVYRQHPYALCSQVRILNKTMPYGENLQRFDGSAQF